ncbi:hypothetical protein [uncultured Brachyspira sp.]|uniref:hypothetical protein n=1 Tax=uncultured Brachyspira sp. TaxID=221953 RepID=UPI0025F25B9B|nr:hypothetical protein [uncultured Brachyspira sp.]
MNKAAINISILLIIIFSLSSCGQKNKTITITNIAIDVPEDFTPGFLNNTVAADNTVAFNESYGAERRTAIYTIVYTKYKSAYSGIINLENAKNNVINGLKNHNAVKDFKLVSEEIYKDMPNSYQILSSFYYGPNKTYHKSFLMLHENGILQIMCMYNANSQKDGTEINNIIKSVRIIENNTNL